MTISNVPECPSVSPEMSPEAKEPRFSRWPLAFEGDGPWGVFCRWPRVFPRTKAEIALIDKKRRAQKQRKKELEDKKAAWVAGEPARARSRIEKNTHRAVAIHKRGEKHRKANTINKQIGESFERRAEKLAAMRAPARIRRKSRKSNTEQIAEVDAAVRATLFLNDYEQRENARFLRSNDTPPKTDEEAATEQLEAERVAGQVDPAQAQKWLTADDIDSATGISATAWNGEIVGDRLIEAYRTLDILPLSTLPASYGSSMPAIIRDETDRKGQAELRESHDRARNRTRLTASSSEIFRMEEAILWPIRLLKQDKFRRIVFYWAQWRAQKKNLRVMCKQKNFNYSTFTRRREIATLAIAYELNKKKIPVQLGEKINSRARRRRKERNSTASVKKKTKVRAVIRGQVLDLS